MKIRSLISIIGLSLALATGYEGSITSAYARDPVLRTRPTKEYKKPLTRDEKEKRDMDAYDSLEKTNMVARFGDRPDAMVDFFCREYSHVAKMKSWKQMNDNATKMVPGKSYDFRVGAKFPYGRPILKPSTPTNNPAKSNDVTKILNSDGLNDAEIDALLKKAL